MKITRVRKLGPRELHERRKQAIVLHQQGMTRAAIAPLVGAHRNTVGQWIGQWIGQWREGGARALKPARPGRPTGSGRRLSQDQERAIRRMITDRCPDQLRLPFALWTRDAATGRP